MAHTARRLGGGSWHLPLVNATPASGEARLDLCAAAFLYNRASDSGAGGGALGVVGALAHSLDTRYRQGSHGVAYAILTGPGMRFNREHNTPGQVRLADIMGVDREGRDDRQAAEAAAGLVAATYSALGLPSRLRDVGVTQQGIGQIASDAMTDFALTGNVRPVRNAGELEQLLREIW